MTAAWPGSNDRPAAVEPMALAQGRAPRREEAIMRILTLSDKVEPPLYGQSLRRIVGDVDLVLSCGDLPDYYLDYVVSVLNVRCYFVDGNHAQGAEFIPRLQAKRHEENSGRIHGCNIHGRLVSERGLLIAGLEGSMRYNNNPRLQYTEREMSWEALKLAPRLLWNRLRCGRSLDILITHAPPAGIHDGDDTCHRGFRSFLTFMRWFRPRYLIHGHMHTYGRGEIMRTEYHDTEVINTYGYQILEVEV